MDAVPFLLYSQEFTSSTELLKKIKKYQVFKIILFRGSFYFRSIREQIRRKSGSTKARVKLLSHSTTITQQTLLSAGSMVTKISTTKTKCELLTFHNHLV